MLKNLATFGALPEAAGRPEKTMKGQTWASRNQAKKPPKSRQLSRNRSLNCPVAKNHQGQAPDPRQKTRDLTPGGGPLKKPSKRRSNNAVKNHEREG